MLTAQELESAALKNPLIYGMSYIDLLQDRKWDMGSRLWQEDIYKAVNPYYIEKNPVGQPRRLVVMKSTQCGLSTAGLVKMFHFADMWNVRVMYTLPRRPDVADFVGTRIDPMIKASPRLLSKLGQPDSTRAKRIGNSFIFFMELSVEPRMMPADALYVDEVDLSDPVFMGTAQNRLDASHWKLNYFFSTPTLPNYGIHGLYLASDRREWLVKCKHCGKEQVLDWDKNLKILGVESAPKKVFYGCQACSEEFTTEDIQTSGRWVAEQPSISEETAGFHVSQLMTHTAPALWVAFKDPQTSLVEFYRKRLGKPLEISGGVLTRADIIENSFFVPHEIETEHDGVSDYYMGVDQGNELQLIVAKIRPGDGLERCLIVHIEVVPFEKGFDRVGELMEQFQIKNAVLDANPNRHTANQLSKDFYGRLSIADYVDAKERVKRREDDKKVTVGVVLGRTLSFDSLYDSIFKGYWQLPGNANAMYPMVDKLIQQTVALRRDVIEEKGRDGIRSIGVWRALGPDHFAHALVYLKTAIELDKLKKRYRIKVIGEGDNTESVDEKEGDVGDLAIAHEPLIKNPSNNISSDKPKRSRIRFF